MFELLAPVFAIAGGLIAGVPVILHMLRRSPAERMSFSIVRFLTPTLPKTTKRARIEHWPLMLLRILAVILIALAFARPFERRTVAKAAESGSADRIAVLLDASASMRRDGIREAVVSELQKIAASLKNEDTFSVSVFSETTNVLLSAAEWRQTDASARATLIDRVITGYEPDWMSTQTAKAMLEAADEVAREEGAAGADGERKVILVTDFQEGSQLDELRSGTWPDSVKLDLRIVRPMETGNAGLSLVEEERTGKVRVRLTNSGDAVATKYSLSLFDGQGQPVGTPVTVDVGAGQRRTVTMPDVADDQPLVAGVEILNEPHSFDNVVDLPIEERGAISIGHVGDPDANNADSMRYYLQRALDGNETDPVELLDSLNSDGIVTPVPDNVRGAIVTESVPEGLLKSLESLVDRGGMMLIALKSSEMATSVNSLLPEIKTVEEASVKDYAMLGEIDFSGGLLSPFADARFADFSSIRFWHYRKLTLDENSDDKKVTSTRVLAKFDTGDPAIVEFTRPSGGKIVVLAAGWQPEDSQWALSTRFPPMIHRLVQLSSPRQSGHQVMEVGQRIEPAELTGGTTWKLIDPAGVTRVADAAPQGSELKASGSDSPAAPANSAAAAAAPATAIASESVVLTEPGRWTLAWDSAEGPKSMTVLVSVAASESRTEPLPVGQLQAMGMSSEIAKVRSPGANLDDPARESQLDAVELESQQKYWRWLLIAGMGLLVLEGIVSSRIERTHGMDMV